VHRCGGGGAGAGSGSGSASASASASSNSRGGLGGLLQLLHHRCNRSRFNQIEEATGS
jgi:hypothetical protein